MENRLERLIGIVFKEWKADCLKSCKGHLKEEDIACFVEGKLPKEECEDLMEHLLVCEYCSDVVSIQARLTAVETKSPSEELVAQIKDMAPPENKPLFLEIFLKLKEKMLEIVNTNGDILVDSELVPAPVLRSRKIKDFKDGVTILKDFKSIRVGVRIEKREAKIFDLNISVKQRQGDKIVPGLRITLLRGSLELESYLTDSGSVSFEHVRLGRYAVEVTTLKEKVATIQLDLKTQ